MRVRPLRNRSWLRFRHAISALLLVADLTLSGCNSHESRRALVLRGQAMGTTWRVTLPRRPDSSAASRWRQEIATRLEQLEAELSHWREDSLVSQFNRTDSTRPFEISSAFAAIIGEAQGTYELTHGAFDITAAPLIEMWGFGPPGRQKELPTPKRIQHVLGHIGCDHLQLGQSASGSFVLSKRNPLVQIDLSALAKGYAIDVIAEYLSAEQFDSYLIELGGELRARGTSASGNVWRIGLEQPDTRLIDHVRRTILLRDRAIATSGGYRNFIHDAKTSANPHSHIIDPRTGRPVDHHLLSVSVIEFSAMRADAWATALMVLGPEEGFQLATERKMAATFVINTASGMFERMTKSFENHVEYSRSLDGLTEQQ